MRQAKPSFKKDQKDSRVTEVYQYSDFLAPRFWGTWCGIGLIYVMAWMPWVLKIAFTHLLCALIGKVAKSRVRTLNANINACFADLPDDERQALAKQALYSNVFGFFETAYAWCRGTKGLNVKIEGWEYYEQAKADGRGILVLSGHFSMLDLGAALIGHAIPVGTIYRKLDNPLLNYFMTRSRERYLTYTVARKDMKGMVRRLKNGEAMGYLPDQDFGRKRAIFLPFFGVQTATIVSTTQLASAGDATVLPVSAYRVGKSSTYVLKFHPLLDIPTDDAERDALTWTQWLESTISDYPDQYLWMHKRFKTRPEGEASIY